MSQPEIPPGFVKVSDDTWEYLDAWEKHLNSFTSVWIEGADSEWRAEVRRFDIDVDGADVEVVVESEEGDLAKVLAWAESRAA